MLCLTCYLATISTLLFKIRYRYLITKMVFSWFRFCTLALWVVTTFGFNQAYFLRQVYHWAYTIEGLWNLEEGCHLSCKCNSCVYARYVKKVNYGTFDDGDRSGFRETEPVLIGSQ